MGMFLQSNVEGFLHLQGEGPGTLRPPLGLGLPHSVGRWGTRPSTSPSQHNLCYLPWAPVTPMSSEVSLASVSGTSLPGSCPLWPQPFEAPLLGEPRGWDLATGCPTSSISPGGAIKPVPGRWGVPQGCSGG